MEAKVALDGCKWAPLRSKGATRTGFCDACGPLGLSWTTFGHICLEKYIFLISTDVCSRLLGLEVPGFHVGASWLSFGRFWGPVGALWATFWQKWSTRGRTGGQIRAPEPASGKTQTIEGPGLFTRRATAALGRSQWRRWSCRAEGGESFRLRSWRILELI